MCFVCVSLWLSQQCRHSCAETFVFQIYANQPNFVLTVSDHMACPRTITRPKHTTKICLFFRMSHTWYWKAIDILAKWGHAKHNCCWAPNSGKQPLRQTDVWKYVWKEKHQKKTFRKFLVSTESPASQLYTRRWPLTTAYPIIRRSPRALNYDVLTCVQKSECLCP